jgi:glycosyltransferase involved in cell wall biosynthesis
MGSLLQEAEAFVHLSSYEGFGLAPVEAMTAGCPVIAANWSCYPEVLGNGPLLVDPDNLEEVADAIIEVTKNKTLKENMIHNGYKQAKLYDWDKTAKRTLQEFDALLST